MKIRLHLVRFMYINLILSCCFWLYDNAVAADVAGIDAAVDGLQLKPGTSAGSGRDAGSEERVTNSLNNFNKIQNVAYEATPAAESAAETATETAAAAAADGVALKLGTAPRTSAKTKTKTNAKANINPNTNTNTKAKAKTKPAAVKDTSVNLNLNVLPSSVNINNDNDNDNDNEDISLGHSSERIDNININNNNNAEEQATAKVPKMINNNVNDNDNDNIYTNINTHVNQLEQLQQPNIVANSHLTKEQQQQKESFPEVITELPTVTVAELPLQLNLVKDHLDKILLQEAPLDRSNKSAEQQQEVPFEVAKSEAQKDELRFNDPGGGLLHDALSTPEANATLDGQVKGEGGQSAETTATIAATSNETAEEVPMPVFSEWAQKQMEAEASREQAMELEQQVVNTSAQRKTKNSTGNGNGKQPTLQLRSKNYASPDCGAKIIASNADATNTGAVLSHSSDEYMLSTCGSRIWFVVELCEAVQAQKVELANFELFSSSPRNFTVAVSKRFPTRDWSNVGRFAAEDKRTVQTFELHPHLFGKFVRVDIHSHYSKEHFCPISLFRVFGTSEYEAFETETRHSDELDDFDDDFAGQEQAPTHKPLPGNAGGANIFQSASDAVIQMVKKAAQVLTKPTKIAAWSAESPHCRTPAGGIYSCASCNSSTVERINNLLSCQSQQLQLLLSLPQLREQLLQTRVCQADYNINLGMVKMPTLASATSGMDKRQSYYLSMLPAEQVGAMCKLLQAEINMHMEQPMYAPQHHAEQQPNLSLAEQLLENVTTAEPPVVTAAESKAATPEPSLPAPKPNLEAETSSEAELPATKAQPEPLVTDSSKVAPTPADVNIFNVHADKQEQPTADTESSIVAETPTSTPTVATPAEANELEAASNAVNTPATTTATTSTTATNAGDAVGGDLVGSGNGMDDGNLANWESIDSLLTTTVASITAGGGAAAAAAAVVNGNAHLAGNVANVAAGNAGNVANAAAAVGGGINLQPKLTHGAQSESVFIRLSNRIKALERNMSLSGQYLEELSRRYKKQVEELQQTLTQHTLTVRTLEDQSRRYIEQEQLYKQQSAELAGDVRALTYQVQACILVIIIVGTCIFLMLVMGTVYYRKLRRQTQQLQPQAKSELAKQKLLRRKSYEQLEQSPGKHRRPSEEAMLILNGCGDIALAEPKDVVTINGRQRKMSVCYGSNNNIAANMLSGRTSLHRRKGAKHSWHTSLDSAQVMGSEQLDKFFDVDTLKSNKLPPKAAKKKSQQQQHQQQQQQELKRQESAPGDYTQGGIPAEETTQSDFDESLILDDDDLSNFIPNSDLAYNEFMPEGPSGYQIVDTVDGKGQPEKAQTVKKSRRVSSPAFFKSPFGKSKNKGGSFNGIGGVKGSQSAHEATSWEWYRLRRSEKHSKHSTVPTVSASASVSPNASLDSSSLSEINFPFNSTQNSFRLLGEAILSSGECGSKAKSSSNVTAVASSSSSSGASTTSSTTKKKHRAFNNLFRKVF